MSNRYKLSHATILKAQAAGAEGARWLAELDARVDDLAHRWQIRLGPVLTGGSASLVIAAERSDGTQAVLKLALPGEDVSAEVRALEHAAGRGYARLWAYDAPLHALLLERLGPAIAALDLPPDDQARTLCQALGTAWVPLSEPTGFMTGADKARWLRRFITDVWQAVNPVLNPEIRERALSYTQSREDAFRPEACVLVHGDAHAGNLLSLPGPAPGPAPVPGRMVEAKFVDPDGLFAEPAYDLGIVMREWLPPAGTSSSDIVRQGRAHCDQLAALTGIDPNAIWQWGFIERVSTGLLLLQIGMDQDGAAILAVADAFL